MPSKNENSTPKVKERIQELFVSSKWHDCSFKLLKPNGDGEELVLAHKVLMASCSPVFEKLFFGPMAEKDIIVIEDVDFLAFQTMLQFIYTDSVEFSSVELACNVLYASKKYFIYTLSDLAISYISDNIDVTNCLAIYNLANFIGEERLINESWKYLCSHLNDVSKFFTHECLSLNLVKSIVNEESLNGDESVVFSICMMWAEEECQKNNLEKTGSNLRNILVEGDIFGKIRFLCLPPVAIMEGQMHSGILTKEEVSFILQTLGIMDAKKSLCSTGVNSKQNKSENQTCRRWSKKNSWTNLLMGALESNEFPFSINTQTEARSAIPLKRIYCSRFIEKETASVSCSKKNLQINTFVAANKSVKLTALYVSAKILPTPQYANSSYYIKDCSSPKNYSESLAIRICDQSNKVYLSDNFNGTVTYGSTIRIPIGTPFLLMALKEYRIEVHFSFSKKYVFGERNRVSKFPSGLCVTFRDEANIGENDSFVEITCLGCYKSLEKLLNLKMAWRHRQSLQSKDE